MQTTNNKYLSLIVFIIIVFTIQLIGGYYTSLSVDTWYPNLKKAPWTPSPWIFFPTWTFLYVLIAISGWLIWISRSIIIGTWTALFVYFIQLSLNLAWSWLFFGLQKPVFALIDIVFLWIMIVINIYLFWQIKPLAALLLIPYLFWVTFAISLNAAISLLN